MEKNTLVRVHLDDFATGVLAGFAAEGINFIHTQRLDEALVRASQQLEQNEIKLTYHMILDPLHGDAPQARRAIAGAIMRGIAHFDSDGILCIDIAKSAASLYFDSLPLDENSWREATRVALEWLRYGA